MCTPVLQRVGIRELRNQSAAVVRRAGAGERIVITVDGRPVAQLGPLEAAEDDLTIDDLAVRGLIEPARRDDRPPPDMVMPVWAGTRLDQMVREIRGR
jgi:prevent-host-death family protein